MPNKKVHKKLAVGVVGCGNISNAYFSHAKHFESMEIVACADIFPQAAKAKAKEFNIKAMTVSALMKSKSIDIILNLTIPQAHAEVNKQALNAGKHVYCEKPFALNLEEAQEVIELSKKKSLRVGCAPDTFLGAGHQNARKIIDDGWLGDVISGTAFMMCAGHESWHPNPGFYYLEGGGPVLDMGPYYITALVNMLGPVESVSAMARKSEDRIVGSQPKKGEVLPVEVNTHTAGLLKFKSGAIITLIMSFDTVKTSNHCIELHGTNGSLKVPNPNGFGGNVEYCRRGQKEFQTIPMTHQYADNSRSIGVADMAHAINHKIDHKVSGDLAYHVLEVMLALDDSAEKQKFVKIKSNCSKPEALAVGLLDGKLDI